MNIKTGFVLVVSLLLLLFQSVYAATYTPVGYWKSIDDVTGKPKSIVYLFTANNRLYGKVVKIFPRPGFDQNEVCSACKGSRHNKRIVGMIVLEGLKQSKTEENKWEGGTVLDPLNGKTYRTFLRVMHGGNQINIRGYIGIPAIGRTQIWFRTNAGR